MIDVGSRVGNYLVRSKLGEGGMGTVYLAEHPEIGSEVAIKVINPSYATAEDAVSRFFTEAKSVNRIKHHNIVDITDFGTTEEGEPYYVMEYLGADSLSARLERGPLALREAAHIAEQIADALGAAHDHGVVHRDIKPDNVFLLDRGGDRPFVKVVDFGLVKLVGPEGAMHETATGVVMGTPYYMSPEQCNSEPDIGAATDIYALGVILYQMVTGKVPFEGRGFSEIVVKHATAAVPDIRDSAPDCPRWLADLIRQCLSKRAEDRPATMLAVRDALRERVGDLADEPATQSSSASTSGMSPDSDPYAKTLATRGQEPETTEVQTVARKPRAGSTWIVGGVGAMGMIAALALVLWVRGGPGEERFEKSDRAAPTKGMTKAKRYGMRGVTADGPLATVSVQREHLEAGKVHAYLSMLDPSLFYMDSITGAVANGRKARIAHVKEIRRGQLAGETMRWQKPRFRHMGVHGSAAWVVTAGTIAVTTKAGKRHDSIANTQLLVERGGVWRTVAMHRARPLTTAAEKKLVSGGKLELAPLETYIGAGAEPVAAAFTRALDSVDNFAAALADRPDTVVLGATWSSQLLGPAARKWMGRIASDFQRVGPVQAGLAADGRAAWAAASIKAISTDRQRGTMTRPYRLFAILIPSQNTWRITAAHFALPVYLPTP